MTVKVLDIKRGINDQVVDIKEQKQAEVSLETLLENYDPLVRLLERDGSRYPMRLLEALLAKPDAQNLLRDGIRYIAFSTMRGLPKTWNTIARVEQSTRPEEQYLKDASIGVIPVKPSGEPVDFVTSHLGGGVKIANTMRRAGVMVTGDDIRYDRLGKIRQIAFELGKAAVATEEAMFYDIITTTGNYTSASGVDNDIAANTAATTFNVLGLDLALSVIGTAKDKHSGVYLGYRADTIIAGPRMEMPIKQLLLSNNLVRAHGNTTAEVRGMGEFNPYQGLLSRIIIAPQFGTSYQFALVDSTAFSFVAQVVQDWDILQEGQSELSEAWLVYNALRYVIVGIMGMGFVDSRAWYYSSSTTAPTVS